MSKFFLQLLLSTMVGVGAALGFHPEVKSELKGTLQEAKSSLHEAAIDLAVAFDAAVSVDADAQSTAKTDGTAALELNSDLAAAIETDDQGSFLQDLFSNLSLDGSSENETRTDTEADTAVSDVGLNGQSATSLDLNLELGK